MRRFFRPLLIAVAPRDLSALDFCTSAVLDAATLLFGASLFQPRIREHLFYSASFSESPFRFSYASVSGESLLLAL